MAIERINVSSSEMKRVLKFIKIMTKSMKFDENMKNVNWKRCRIRNNFFYMLMPKQKGVKYKKVKLGSVKALLSTFGKPDEKNIILYLHGGGFVTGSAFVCKSYCSTLAKYSKCMVYAAEYSLAPEKPFPAGFNDCCNAFEEIVKLHPNAKIALVGESAGGNYSIALALKYKEKVSCVIANSPAVDFSSKVEYDKNEDNDFIVKRGCLKPLIEMYVGDNDISNPYISPIYGDFTNFPPTLITCDINETLYVSAQALYQKCKEANIDVTMIEAVGTCHAFAVAGSNTPETMKILNRTVEFIKKYGN